MTSIINSETTKNIVFLAVEKALKDCALQHEVQAIPYNGIEPNIKSIQFACKQPTKLKMSFEFIWDEEYNNTPMKIFCQPIIDLLVVEEAT